MGRIARLRRAEYELMMFQFPEKQFSVKVVQHALKSTEMDKSGVGELMYSSQYLECWVHLSLLISVFD